MRALIQRVLEASVTVEGKRVAEIGPGLLVFLGVGKGDGPTAVEWMVEKVSNLRIFEDDAGKMNRSLLETHRALIAVSQFTLYGDAQKGRRPSFAEAGHPDLARPLYQAFCDRTASLGIKVGTGIFAADMKVALVNDGPVTIWVESP